MKNINAQKISLLSEQEKRELRNRCTRFLSNHRPKTPREWLQELAHSTAIDLAIDQYGDGPAIAQLEQEVATLLGKEAAVFVPKGVIAQAAALRVWTDYQGVPTVAIHPKSHIDLDEGGAYERLHNLRPLRLGNDHVPFGCKELETVHEPLGAITLELPLRRAGFKLLDWDELLAVSNWARKQRVPLHFDGARLWECGPFYDRSYAEIAALADSIYVSFYKGLGGLAGCVLAGTAEFIDSTKVWQQRHGGFLFTAFPFVLAALDGIKHHLPKISTYCTRAREVAAALATLPGVTVAPEPPHTNAFQVYLPGDRDRLEWVALELAQSEQLWLFNDLNETAIPGLVMAEVSIGDAAEALTTAEILTAIDTVIKQAAQIP